MATTFTNPFPVPVPPGFDLRKQAVILPGTAKAGQTGTYVSASFPSIPNPFTSPSPSPAFPNTAYECFNFGLKTNPAANCLGRRPWDADKGDWAMKYEWESYDSVDKARTRVGSGLKVLEKELGGTEKDWKVGIWSVNRPEWQYISQACSAYSLVLVSLYDTLGPNVVEFCIDHSVSRVVFATANHIPALLALAGAKKCGSMRVVVSIDRWAELDFKKRPGTGSEATLKKWGDEVGVKVLDLTEVEALGTAHFQAHIPPRAQDTASICYTSGTTGNPKGAVLLHGNLAGAATGNLHGGTMEVGGVFMSYLPLSHIYERFCEDTAFAAASSIGYSCGDNLRLLEDLALLQPTYFVSVPRVLNRVYQSIKAQTIDAPGFKGTLTRKAFGDKLWNLEHKGTFTHAFWDRIVFKKIRGALGGKVAFIGSGSAPIDPAVLAFLKVAFSCEVSEGYGQTENCGTAVKCVVGDTKPNGTVGPPQVGVEVKLVDVPEMGYFSTDLPVPRGELCTRGSVVIPEYYKDPAKSKEALDSDGWLHSGDIASVDEFGRFKIIDRIKNLVKLSQGEYVALEKVENTYALNPLIAQIYIHADSLEDHVVAVLIPDPEKLAGVVSKVTGTTVAGSDVAALKRAANDPAVVKAVAGILEPNAASARLLGYERIKDNIHISLEMFSMDNDQMTPTFKNKRNVIAKAYEKELKGLYAKSKKVSAKL